MKRSGSALSILLLLLSLAAWAIAAPTPGTAPAAAPPKNIMYINGVPDTGAVFLPDSALLGRVDERRITAGEFVETYFNAYAPDRPEQDSSGRVEWLNSMVNKEVLAKVAKKANRPFTFEDRQALRERTQRVLSNMLFIRAVLDSVRVTEADVKALYQQLGTEYHLRRMVVPGGQRADSIYRVVAARRSAWDDAYARYSIPQDDAGPNGDLGWVTRYNMTWAAAEKITPLKAGAVAPPLRRVHGFEIFYCLDTRHTEPPSMESMGSWLVSQVRTKKQFELADRMQEGVRRAVNMKYDSLNIAWAAPQFMPAMSTTQGKEGTPSIHINAVMPVIQPTDTSRVVARYRDGTLTLSRFMTEYGTIAVTRRPDVSTPEGFRSEIDAIVLEPYRAQIAVERGLDKDPAAVAAIEKERERILVEHMYQDSVESKIYITKEQRQKYYHAHLANFFTYAAARYAQFVYTDSVAAKAMAKRLRGGERGDAIVSADSIAGRKRTGSVKIERENENTMFHQLVFENLKPGQVEVVGPDANGRIAVIQLLDFDPGHQLTFEQADHYCSDALQSEKAEELINKLLARHKKGLKIETHPQLVMRIRLVDPTSTRQ